MCREPHARVTGSLTAVTSVDDMLAFIDASPSPYHAVEEAARRLADAGFQAVEPDGEWSGGPGRHMVQRGGALVAWEVPEGASPHQRFRIVGAHTDSPNLRVKPEPDTGAAGWQQLAVEVYGGALWNSWLDRDLGLSGRAAVRTDRGVEQRLLRIDEPLLRIPQLAIHLDRGVSEGLKLDPQRHLTPVWGVGPVHPGGFREVLEDHLGVASSAILGWDVMLHDVNPGTRLGTDGELVSVARIDNLLSCWAATEAIGSAAQTDAAPDPHRPVGVICLYDHEEVGSTSATGADGALLGHVLERSVLARGGTRDDHLRAMAGSVCASADGAHATHPNYAERHEPGHQVAIDGGPVIKVNANQRYATDAGTAAVMVDACERAGVPHQWFVSRNDMPCGSTIGPVTAARLGIPTVDVGVAQLSMHSARELCGAEDPVRLTHALRAFLAG